MAAHRHGIFEAVLPRDNEKDLPDIPETIRKEMRLHFVETMDEVLKIALEREIEALPMPANPAIELPARHERREIDALGISGENRLRGAAGCREQAFHPAGDPAY